MLATSTSTVMTTQTLESSSVMTTETPSPSQSSNFKYPTKSKSAIGAAVGGTIGGIALLALLAVCLIRCRTTSPQVRSFEQAQVPDRGSIFRTLDNERPLTLSEVGDGRGGSMQGMDT